MSALAQGLFMGLSMRLGMQPWLSPCFAPWASYFSCFAKKSNQKKATPEVTVRALCALTAL